MSKRKIGPRMEKVLAYIQANPGVTAAQCDRATNDYYGQPDHAHRLTYASVNKLINADFVFRVPSLTNRSHFRLYCADAWAVDHVTMADGSQREVAVVRPQG